MNRLRAVMLSAFIGACITSAHRNSRVDLAGVVRDSLTGTPLAGAQVFLTDDTTLLHGPPRRWPRGVVTDSAGRFAFHDVQPGFYVLHTRFIGFYPRWVRVAVPVARGELLTLRLHPAAIRTGFGLSDPTEVAKNRKRVSGWTCRRSDPEEMVRHVIDPEVCRRAGRAYDRMIGATDIHFLVLEAGPILIVADGRNDATVLVDREYRVLTAFVVP